MIAIFTWRHIVSAASSNTDIASENVTWRDRKCQQIVMCLKFLGFRMAFEKTKMKNVLQVHVKIIFKLILICWLVFSLVDCFVLKIEL